MDKKQGVKLRQKKRGSLFCVCWTPQQRYSDGFAVGKEFEETPQMEYGSTDILDQDDDPTEALNIAASPEEDIQAVDHGDTSTCPEEDTQARDHGELSETEDQEVQGEESESNQLMTVEVEYVITRKKDCKCGAVKTNTEASEVNEDSADDGEKLCQEHLCGQDNIELEVTEEPAKVVNMNEEQDGAILQQQQQVGASLPSDTASIHSSDGSTQDYDVPPPTQLGHTPKVSMDMTYDNPPVRGSHVSRGESVYDSPPRQDSSHSIRGDDTYDVPRAHLVIKGLDTPPVGSNRSSTVSMLSTGSSALSARNSLDTSGHDIYDYPPAPKVVTPGGPPSRCHDNDDVYDTPPSARLLTDNNISQQGDPSMAKEPSYQEISDIPMKLDQGLPLLPATTGVDKVDSGDYIDDDYAVPRSDTSRSSADSGFETSSKSFDKMSDIYDVPPGQRPLPMKESHMESGKGNVDVALQRLTVSSTEMDYDVPPQVSKDSPSKPSPSSSKALWDSSESCDPEPYEPLRLEVEAALELLAKLQQEVHGAAYRLLSFVGKNWRKSENLHPKLYSIRLACLSVKTSLQEYLEFCQGAAANAATPDKRDLNKELNDLIDPLMDALTKIKMCIKNLEAMQWQTDKLAVDTEEGENSSDRTDDDLDGFVNVTKKIPLNARTLTLVIQGNAKCLFRVVKDAVVPGGPGTPAKPLVSSPHLERSRHHTPANITQSPTLDKKPPLGKASKPPPPPLRPKPRLSSAERSPSMKDRPLPTPPPAAEAATPEADSCVSQEPVYNTPKHTEKVYNEIAEKSSFLEHYDYVHLTKGAEKGLRVDSGLSINTDEDASSSQRSSGADLLDTPPRVKNAGLSPKFMARLERLQQDAEKPVEIHTECSTYDNPTSIMRTVQRTQLPENDQLILDFYASQVDTHIEVLHNAIDAFMKCVDYNQPPKIFIAHSKFVVLAAHKLVYIGDTISRNLQHEGVRHQVMTCGNHLCDCLKATVVGTKNAALNFPSVSVSQEMVDRVVEVSHAANSLKQLISDASSGD